MRDFLHLSSQEILAQEIRGLSLTLFFADGTNGAGVDADGVAAVFFAVGALVGIDDVAGIALLDSRIGAFGGTGTAADALVRIDLAGHWICPS